MNQYYDKWSEAAKKLQEPLHEIAELNVKTVQGLTYLKPEDLIHIKKPEQLLEKQVAAAVENGHKAIDYMQKSFEIIEKAMLNFVYESKRVVEGKN